MDPDATGRRREAVQGCGVVREGRQDELGDDKVAALIANDDEAGVAVGSGQIRELADGVGNSVAEEVGGSLGVSVRRTGEENDAGGVSSDDEGVTDDRTAGAG